MELESIHLLWNLVLTGIVAPFVWFIVQLHNETKRLAMLKGIEGMLQLFGIFIGTFIPYKTLYKQQSKYNYNQKDLRFDKMASVSRQSQSLDVSQKVGVITRRFNEYTLNDILSNHKRM